MAMTDQPTIRIDGQTIVGGWSQDGALIALGGMAITWGRKSHFDDAKPAQMSLELIDRAGMLASATHFTGKRIEIARGDGRVIFQGRLDDYDIEPLTVLDPVTNEPRRVWRLSMSAACKLAELGQAVLPGPGTNATIAADLGPNYYETAAPATRLAQVMSAGANQIVNGIDWKDPYGAGGWYPLARFRKFADNMSALDFIESVYNAIPAAHVTYDPSTNRITSRQPVKTNGLRLEWNGDTLSLKIAGEGATIAAKTVVAPNGYKVTTGITEATDVVQVSTPQQSPSTGYDIVETTVEERTTRFDPTATGRHVHSVKNDIWYNPGTGPDAWQYHLARDTRDIVNALNGKMILPPIRLDWRLFDYADDVTDALLDTTDKPIPLYFPGSVFNVISDAGATHQVIGGKLVYHDGWTHDVTLAPAITPGDSVTVDQLVATPDPTMDDYDAVITLADLGGVTIGVPA